MKFQLLFCLALSGATLLSCGNDSEPAASETETGSETGTAPPADGELAIEPGRRVGAITTGSTFEELVQVYGAANVARDSFYIGEGQFQEGLLLFRDTPRELSVAIGTDGTAEFVRIEREGTAWKSPEGVTVGTTLEELTRINGSPFAFYGFGWDYGGIVNDWLEGSLSPDLLVILAPADPESVPAGLLGDHVIASDAAEVQGQEIGVEKLMIRLP